MRWLALAAVLLLPATVQAGSQDFALVNRTGFTIEGVFVTQAGRREQGQNVLGRDTLEDGETATVAFARDEPGCRWTLVVRFRSRQRGVWPAVDLCAVSRVAVFWDRRAGAAVVRVE